MGSPPSDLEIYWSRFREAPSPRMGREVFSRVMVWLALLAAGVVVVLLMLAAWDAYQGRMTYLEDRVAALEAKALEPRPLFVVAKGYKGHVFVNGKEVPK